MYADRTARGRINPASMAAAVGINGALIAALLLSSPEIRETFDPPIEGYNVPNPPPPPPPPEPEIRPIEKVVEARPLALPDAPDPVIDTPRGADVIVGTSEPPIPAGSGDTGTSSVVVDPPKPAPVFVEASPDPQAARDFQPPFPPSEQRLGNSGSVTVRVLIGADGRVKDVRSVSAASDAFFDAASGAVALALPPRDSRRGGV